MDNTARALSTGGDQPVRCKEEKGKEEKGKEEGSVVVTTHKSQYEGTEPKSRAP